MVFGLQDVIKLSQMLETTDASEAYKRVARYKLDCMLTLCETTDCRRRFLLNYFEEDLDQACGNCDSCLLPAETWDATVDAQKVLSVIYRTGQIYGSQYIVDILRGSKNNKVVERGHDKLSAHGCGKDLSKRHWSFVLRQLLNQKYITIKNWEYRSLALTSKSREILKSEVQFSLRKQKDSVGAKKRVREAHQLSHDHDELFEKLRALRRELADQKKMPPFMIFGDKSLHDMCQILPRNKSEFMLVNGVGESKCQNYSEVFLKTINEYLAN
jgi:ATP-dependent DNA helicase RecQ